MLPDPVHDEKAKQLISVAHDFSAKVPALMVRTPREFEIVSRFRADAKAHWNMLEAKRKEDKEEYLDGGRKVDAYYAAALKFCADAVESAKSKLICYETEQERIAAEEQRRLEEKARKEREALEAKARAEREKADREAAELKRQADEARAANNLAESVRLRNQADKIVEKSEVRAEAALTKAELIVTPKVTAYIPPVQGQFTKVVWRARVKDKKSVPEEFKVVDQAMLDKMAQATKGQVPIAGVEFYSEKIMSGRAK